jgi:hypothetical protein
MAFITGIDAIRAHTLIEPCVRFKEFNIIILTIIKVVAEVSTAYGVTPVITGSWGENIYPLGGIHDKGHAIDYRSSIYTHPSVVALDIQKRLQLVDKGFRVLYHDSGNGKHFHIYYGFSHSIVL